MQTCTCSLTIRFCFSFSFLESANLLPPHQTDWLTGGDNPLYRDAKEVPESVRANPSSGWWKTDGRYCRGVLRWRPTAAQREKLHAAWPADRPNYWMVDAEKAFTRSRWDLAAAVTEPRTWYANGAILLTHFRRPYTAAMRAEQPQIFPISDNQSLARLRPYTSPIEEETALIGDGETNRGFVYCDVSNSAVFKAVTGQDAVLPACRTKIDDITLPWFAPATCSMLVLWPIFQRDDYMISHLQYTRG